MTDDRELRARMSVAARARGFGGLLWATIIKFFGDDCSTMAAALSFYTFFSLPALLTLLLTIAGRVMDPMKVQNAIVGQVGKLIGEAGSGQVSTILAHAAHSDGTASVATLLSLLALMSGATATFSQLQSALNRVWRVKPDPRRNQIRVFLSKRIFSFGLVITVAFLLLVSLALTTALTAVATRWTGSLTGSNVVMETLTSVVGFALIAVLFAFMFRYLPDARIAWRDVRAGALGSALLFVLGKSGIGLYLGSSDPGKAYGAAGALAIVLIWVYYTAMVLLLGAEFTEQWAERLGRGVRPDKGAISYVEEERKVSTG